MTAAAAAITAHASPATAATRPLRVGVIVFPGSNCDRDAGNAAADAGFGAVEYLWHADTDLRGVEAVLVPGGFSYGDALRAGAIARQAPLMNTVAKFAADGGPVVGICNGFQILCEAGLLPGALVRNAGLRFVCRPVHLRVENTQTPFTTAYEPGEVLTIPVAHGEGQYVCDDADYAALVRDNRIVFRYCEANGQATPEASFNGARDGIAGIVGGPARNVLGMMPHPERAMTRRLGSDSGARLFLSLLAHLQPENR